MPNPEPGEGTAGCEFDLFVSYASEDRDAVERLVSRLHNDGYALWFDKTQMHGSGTVAENLKQAVDRSRQMLICLSNSYCLKDYTRYELQLNFAMDAANLRQRAITAVVRGPLTVPVPAEIVSVPRVDLTDPGNYEHEYRRLKRSILPPTHPLPAFPTPAEIRALRKLPNPEQVLVAICRRANELFAYIYRAEFKQPARADLTQAAEALCSNPHLAADIQMHIRTISWYAKLIDKDFNADSIEPAFQALLRLSSWACQRYSVAAPVSDAFQAFWAEVVPQLPSAELPFQLAGDRRSLMLAGGVFLGQGIDGHSQWDLLVIPANTAQTRALSSEVEACKSMGEMAPLQVRWHQTFDLASSGEWQLIASSRPGGVSIPALVERFRPLPKPLAVSLFGAVCAAFDRMAVKSPVLAASVFRMANVVLDRAGEVRLSWNWEQMGVCDATGSLHEFWFCRPPGGASAASEAAAAGSALRKALLDTLAVSADVDLSGSQKPGEERDTLQAAVGSFLDKKELPAWLTAEPAPVPAAPEPSIPPDPPVPIPVRVPPADRWHIPADCRCAWPLGEDRILVWRSDDSLGVFSFRDAAVLWSDMDPFHLRVAALDSDGRVAVGSWEGEIKWFGVRGLEGSVRLDGPIGDIRAFAGRWLAGSWNENLRLVGGGAPLAALPGVSNGVRRIAVGEGESFAVLSLQDCVSLYRAGHRVAQIGPVPGVLDIAFSNGLPMVLTSAGLVTMDSSGKVSEPDRLPSRSGIRLLASPPGPACILVNDQGQSWTIDRAGTYPRGPWLPAGNHRSMTTARGFTRCLAQTQIGFTYWRNAVKVRSWGDAVSAVLSPDGKRVVATLPGAIEVFEDPV
ncbi:MAG: toll/interleukin-1 receptor domain-containing protein [Terracidiphilus sp.]|jgi:hypothetical protein